jgi:glycosyltransferase involved in cell wall biosynthesis
MMDLPFKIRRSAGIPVSPAMHRLIATANRARDGRQWEAAVAGYRAALDGDPSLVHIWIQLGHAHKELGAVEQAERCYSEASERAPGSAEPHVHLGHLAKDQGRIGEANRHYLAAVQAEPNHPDALAEAMAIVPQGAGFSQQLLAAVATQPEELDFALPVIRPIHDVGDASASVREILDMLRGDGEHALAGGEGASAAAAALVSELERLGDTAREIPHASHQPALVFDVSDLVSYFRNARLPTGIQRVQIETISHALRDRAGQILICAFAERRDEWVGIPAERFLGLARLSLADGDRTAPDWISAITRLHLLMQTAPALEFPDGACLVNLGTSWWLQNYFLFIRNAKRDHGVRYIPFVHDFIPIMAPEHCVRELTQDFISWAIGAFDHADHFLANSEATKRDLLRVAEYLGHQVSPADVTVIRLDADSRKADAPAAPRSALARWGLDREPYVLFVSTIESRKDHIAAFEAWIALIGRFGMRRVPKLVCVGNRGWLNDAVYARLETHDALRSRVVMLSGISDPELALLYRNCLFTLYPSRYEGWGLPVTESLCHGKVPVCSDASSLPEAGGEFAVYFRSGAVDQLIEQLERLLFEPGRREGLEQAIAARFRPRGWGEIAGDMMQALSGWSARDVDRGEADMPGARLGAYYPITRSVATRIWPGMRSAEVFRSGPGWWWPDNWGCWTKAHGGTLDIRISGQVSGTLRLYLHLHAMPHLACPYDIRIPGGPAISGILPAGSFKWLSIDIEAPGPGGTLKVEMLSDASEDLALCTDGADTRVVSIGVAGFFLCVRDDVATRTDFIEAVALNDVESLAFNRDPGDAMAALGPLV